MKGFAHSVDFRSSTDKTPPASSPLSDGKGLDLLHPIRPTHSCPLISTGLSSQVPRKLRHVRYPRVESRRSLLLNVPFTLPIKGPSRLRGRWNMNISTRGGTLQPIFHSPPGQSSRSFFKCQKRLRKGSTPRVLHRKGPPNVDRLGLQTGFQEWACNSYITGNSPYSSTKQELGRKFRGAFDPKGLLPKENPAIPRVPRSPPPWQSHAVVGGDHFDVLPFGRRSMGICIADVAGKGILSAILMSIFKPRARTYRAVFAQTSLHPPEFPASPQYGGDRFRYVFYAQWTATGPVKLCERRQPVSRLPCTAMDRITLKGRCGVWASSDLSNRLHQASFTCNMASPHSFHRRRNEASDTGKRNESASSAHRTLGSQSRFNPKNKNKSSRLGEFQSSNGR